MNVSCDIIHDLLPLYAEDMVSTATKEMVDAHLCGCDECTKELGAMIKKPAVPMEVETKALATVKKSINRRRILAVVTALLLVVTLAFGYDMFMAAPVYLSAEEAINSVEQMEDGSIHIYYNGIVSGTGSILKDSKPGNWGVACWAYMEDVLFPAKRLQENETRAKELGLETKDVSKHTYSYGVYGNSSDGIIDPDISKNNFCYINAKDGTVEKVIWEGAYPVVQVPLKDVNYHIGYYFAGLIVLALLFTAAAYLMRKIKFARFIRITAVFFGCAALSVLIVSAGQFMELWSEFTECFQKGWLLTIPMFATALCGMKLFDLNRKDRIQ